jgi:homocysteine S-methyltransferase
VESVSSTDGNPFAAHLAAKGFVLLDGGLATALERRGHDLRDQLWSASLLLDDPDEIAAVHAAYLQAGADCVTTSAYQATIPGFQRRGAGRLEAVEALVRSTGLARQAVDAMPTRDGPEPLVAASIGPYGAWLADGSEYDGRYGRSAEELADFHRERFGILCGSGPDVLACETLPSAVEVDALLSLLDETEVWAWFSFACRDDRTLHDGTAIEEVVERCTAHPRVAAVGVNCTEPRWVGGLVERIRHRTPLPVIAYPNSGERWDGRTKRWLPAQGSAHGSAQGSAHGSGEPKAPGSGAVSWLEGLRDAWRAGARIVGGCCRTGPEEIRELRARILGGDFPAL